MFTTLLNILKLYAPILPFVTEEIYQIIYTPYNKDKSIHKTSWPKINNQWNQSDSIMWNFLKEIDNIRKEKALKGLRYKDQLDLFIIQSFTDMTLFGDKLKKMFKIKDLRTIYVEWQMQEDSQREKMK